MAFPDYQIPNLASILQTLAAYAPPQLPPSRPPQQGPPPDLEEGEYDPSTFQPSSASQPLRPQPPSSLPPQTIQPAPASAPQPPTEKASLITTWPPALRHVTKLLSSSPPTASRIRHLISSAHNHERQWWSGRETLMQKLAGRDASRQKLDTVLASLGGNTGASSAPPEVVDVEEEEQKMYDRKVYKAYGEMVGATHMELKRLGIPFFAIQEKLIVRGVVVGEVEKGMVGDEELERLKGRMVEFLEDMVRE